MKIKPIKTKKDYQTALLQIEKLFNAKSNTPEGDFLEILTILVNAYEEKHFPIEFPDPIDAIEYYMESRGLSRKDLEPYIGKRGRVSEILLHKRQLTLAMIQKLCHQLGIPAAVLIQR